MRNKTSRAYLMRKWQEYSFAAYEARLYLDTHPASRAALQYFNKYNALQHAAARELQTRYGAVNTNIDMPLPDWSWIEMPWPWNETDETDANGTNDARQSNGGRA